MYSSSIPMFHSLQTWIENEVFKTSMNYLRSTIARIPSIFFGSQAHKQQKFQISKDLCFATNIIYIIIII